LQRKVTCLWKEPGVQTAYRSAVSLHGHTNHSKESLYFIVEFASRHLVLRRALAMQERRAKRESSITVDFWKGYWTPPLPPLSAFQLESRQIERGLGLASMVSLTDHDNIEAPMLLRVVPEARRIPVSVEWTVPFRDATFHLGVHNLPSGRAESIMGELRQYTRDVHEPRLRELLRMLHADPDILVILNHPLWDLAGIGRQRHGYTLNAFAAELGMFLHGFELSGLRSWEENLGVQQLAEGWNQVLISGGDRHGCEPNAALNLTDAESFTEFVHEIRKERRSHVLFMPQYAEAFTLRILQTLLDVIRTYPDYPLGSRFWDERTFHPDCSGAIRPLATMWRRPPAFIELFFSAVRMLEMDQVKRVMQIALADPGRKRRLGFGQGQEVAP
jgi:hypothetical protein